MNFSSVRLKEFGRPFEECSLALDLGFVEVVEPTDKSMLWVALRVSRARKPAVLALPLFTDLAERIGRLPRVRRRAISTASFVALCDRQTALDRGWQEVPRDSSYKRVEYVEADVGVVVVGKLSGPVAEQADQECSQDFERCLGAHGPRRQLSRASRIR